MKNLIDLHTHTVLSEHAYSTFLENVTHAKEIGLKYYGVSDHAYGLTGGISFFSLSNLKILPKELYGVKILKGVELNITDSKGTVDFTVEQMQSNDYAIASLHTSIFKEELNIENCTNAYLNIIENPKVKILGHIDDGNALSDYEQVILKAKQHKVLIELNNSSLVTGFRKDSEKNIITILNICKKHNAKVIINSDAHFCLDVGNMNKIYDLIIQHDFPLELVANFNEDIILDYFY